MTRTFEAPVELVWKVLTTPEYIKDWWGPEGFTNTIREMNPVTGGTWDFTMHGPDGVDYENRYVYSEIVPMKKIVLDHLLTPKFSIIVTLNDEGTNTSVTWQNVFESIPSLEEALRSFKADEGLKQTLNRLNNHLNSHQK